MPYAWGEGRSPHLTSRGRYVATRNDHHSNDKEQFMTGRLLLLALTAGFVFGTSLAAHRAKQASSGTPRKEDLTRWEGEGGATPVGPHIKAVEPDLDYDSEALR